MSVMVMKQTSHMHGPTVRPRLATKLAVGVTALVLTAVTGVALAPPPRALAATRPVVTHISPATGPLQGGNTVIIRGRRFKANGHRLVKKVMFGRTAATKVSVRSATRIIVRAPKGTGTVNVRVITSQGESPKVPADRYTYAIQPLKVMGVSPATGSTAGGTVVTISGGGFTGVTAVTFGTTAAASFTFVSDSTIQATAPAGKGTVDVTVTTPAGTSRPTLVDHFSYYAPATITAVSPVIGPAAGGTQVTVTGKVLFSTTKVWFGKAPASSFTVKSDSKIVATAPAGAGTVDVTVTTPAGTTATTASDRFTYVAKIAPNAGDNQSAAAGTAVATAPSVLVTDALGNPVAGVSVTFAVASGGGSVGGSPATTDASGIATVGSWTLGTSAGPNSLTASSTEVPNTTVTFNATATAGAAAEIAPNAGDNQSAAAGTAIATAPSVLVTDAHGNPVAGVSVTFAVASGGGSVGGSPATTDASGIATVGSWTLGTSAGPNSLTASSTEVPNTTVTFNASATAGAATQLVVTAPASATAGQPFDVTVTAEDAYGNVATGYRGTVTFASSDPAATLPVDYTFTSGDGGNHTFSGGVTLSTAGGQTVTATDTAASSITGTSDTVTVST